MASECSTSGACQTGSESCKSSAGSCRACGTDCCGDPIACAMGMWSCAFFQAMKEAQVELLKEKIRKAWGAKMDKAADAVLEAMGTKWQSMLSDAKSKADLRAKLQGLWQ